jgi:polyvinyl alcohol dehydrogenase (cytochrome)
MLRGPRNLSLPAAQLIGMSLLLVLGLRAQGGLPESPACQWGIERQNLSNTWSQSAKNKINPANVNDLSPTWVFTTGGDISATPTVAADPVYFPDRGDNLFAVREQIGDLTCSHKICEYDGVVGAISRVSPDGGVSATSMTARLAPESSGRFLLPKKMEVRS